MFESGLSVRSELRQKFIYEMHEERERIRMISLNMMIETKDKVDKIKVTFILQLLLWLSFGCVPSFVTLVYENLLYRYHANK